jgi:hypothetical protein
MQLQKMLFQHLYSLHRPDSPIHSSCNIRGSWQALIRVAEPWPVRCIHGHQVSHLTMGLTPFCLLTKTIQSQIQSSSVFAACACGCSWWCMWTQHPAQSPQPCSPTCWSPTPTQLTMRHTRTPTRRSTAMQCRVSSLLLSACACLSVGLSSYVFKEVKQDPCSIACMRQVLF